MGVCSPAMRQNMRERIPDQGGSYLDDEKHRERRDPLKDSTQISESPYTPITRRLHFDSFASDEPGNRSQLKTPFSNLTHFENQFVRIKDLIQTQRKKMKEEIDEIRSLISSHFSSVGRGTSRKDSSNRKDAETYISSDTERTGQIITPKQITKRMNLPSGVSARSSSMKYEKFTPPANTSVDKTITTGSVSSATIRTGSTIPDRLPSLETNKKNDSVVNSMEIPTSPKIQLHNTSGEKSARMDSKLSSISIRTSPKSPVKHETKNSADIDFNDKVKMSSTLQWDEAIDKLVTNYSRGNLLHIEIDLSQYTTEEITVDIVNEHLMVNAKVSKELDERTIIKQFRYSLRLPKGTESKHISRYVTLGALCKGHSSRYLHLYMNDTKKIINQLNSIMSL
ncbi:uncharacterized protein LOC111638881 [Centruroides sculpturatus]|uniref:uncharacterized protein LOC111638881 n=1 Tax=Centruroides sculpturatus TaxID=218467 RepID=UPI000C6DFD88|nr:uncharacterized protein LOC111638881 [Centruroides sculpturatus]